MNIYLIERTDYVTYDQYLGAVVLANNEDEARAKYPLADWTYDAALIRVTLVGVATPEYCAACEGGMVLESFRAG